MTDGRMPPQGTQCLISIAKKCKPTQQQKTLIFIRYFGKNKANSMESTTIYLPNIHLWARTDGRTA